MYVLIGVEWFQKGPEEKRITQIGARRVTGDFESMAEFSCLVCPSDSQSCEWEHMAYSGYSPGEFLNSGGEAECFKEFTDFLPVSLYTFPCCFHIPSYILPTGLFRSTLYLLRDFLKYIPNYPLP